MKLVSAHAVTMAILMVIAGIVGIFVSKALWAHKNWARIVIIIFSALGIINGLIHLPAGIISIVIQGAILYFLAFEKSVVHLFK